MEEATLTCTPIGIIRTPFKTIEDMPIQPTGARGVAGSVELRPGLAPGLKDLEGFSHLILLYHFHKVSGYDLEVVPFLDDTPRGLFSTRAPRRPNPIGLSVVRLTSVEGSTLRLEDIDVLDRTPLLDIKPFVPAFDAPTAERTGWLEGCLEEAVSRRSDHRFAGGGA